MLVLGILWLMSAFNGFAKIAVNTSVSSLISLYNSLWSPSGLGIIIILDIFQEGRRVPEVSSSLEEMDREINSTSMNFL